jgi:hypothetical protein
MGDVRGVLVSAGWSALREASLLHFRAPEL